MIESLDLLLRTCDRVHCHSGLKRIVDSKSELIMRSLNSLLRSIAAFKIEHSHTKLRLILVDDNSSKDLRGRMLRLCLARGVTEAQIVDVEGQGNGDSLKTHYEWARDNSEGLIYFLEDDYLHEESMLTEMVEFYMSAIMRPGMEEIVLHPCDYPDRYKELHKSWILLGSRRHWRSIQHTTSTMMISRPTLDKHWDKFMGLTEYGKTIGVNEDNTINKIHQQAFCFSPMPTLSTHLQYEWTLSPYTPWKPLWENL